ncbi:MAG: hypothetical protein ACOVP2_01450 [Armatimonadaceae bacterium]
MSARKSWNEKLQQCKAPKVVILEKAWGGMSAGDRMYISSPLEVDAAIRRLPPGKVISLADFRHILADHHGCAGTCHLTTSIFIRIAAEAAREQLDAGASLADVTPFWRVVVPGSPLAKKMLLDDAWLAERLAEEQPNHGM